MTNTPSIDLEPIAGGLALSVDRVQRTLELLDEGNTVAFITRYRKDPTGGLDEEQIRAVQREAAQSRQLADRKASVLKLIEAQEKLTPGLRKRIESATSLKRLEELYLPFKTNKPSLAALARQRGLAPLADEVLSADGCELSTRASDFLSHEHGLETLADVLAGVKHIIAESFSERTNVRERLRSIFARTGKLTCSKHDSTGAVAPSPLQAGITDGGTPEAAALAEATDGAVASSASARGPKTQAPKISVRQRKRSKLENSLRDYLNYSESIGKIRAHRVLAINRGERAKILRVRIDGDLEALNAAAIEMLVDQKHPNAEFLGECVRSALSRSVIPSLERELRREMSETAETHAVAVFAKNLRKLFLQRPVHGRRVLAIDPGFKSGCKLAALDEFGGVLQHATVFLIGDENKRDAAQAKIAEFVTAHDLSVIAIGNGAACRDAEQVVAAAIGDQLNDRHVEYVIVNEAGASVYSTSAIGREELPEFDATIRSAVSIGRRLLDPLSELVKINPANIGVGMYQHDAKAKHLRESLDAVVESCVNFVGVDVNTASPSLLSYVSGLNQLTARRLYEYRLEHGPFRNREQIREVPGIGEATFIQAAGFLKIIGGDNPFDATWIHPESYDVARQVLERLGSSIAELAGVVSHPASDTGTLAKTAAPRPLLDERHSVLNLAELAEELGVGELSLRDILDALAKPGRDPRDDLPAPTFRSGIIKIDDIEPGMQLAGTVLNVVDFGAFVDIGICETSLIHISRLADHYVRDPHDVVSIGDVLPVWVLEVDRERRRVKLTAIPPGTRPAGKGSGARADARKSSAVPRQRKSPHKTTTSKHASGPRPPKFSQAAKRKATANQKPAKPITQQMVQGKEPMRTFSDLLQYYEVKRQDDSNETPDE